MVRHIGPQCTMHPLRASGPVHVCHTSSSSRFDFRATPHRHSVIARVSASVPGPDDKTLPSSASAAQPVASLSAPASGTSSPDAGVGSNEQEQKPLGLFQRIKRYFVGDKADKQKLAALGMGAFLAYGMFANLPGDPYTSVIGCTCG